MKSKVKFVLLMLGWLTLAHSMNGQCSEGCIKCGKDSSGADECKICDLFSSFYMDSTKACVRREIENCLIPSSDQNEYFCAQCKMGFILDPEAAKCVEVPANKNVKNCRQYTLVGTCKHCFQFYHLEGNKCEPAGVIIENCRTYFGDDLCEECMDDYYFDVESNKCVSFKPLDNCHSHTFKTCNACRRGFHKNANSMYLGEIDGDYAQKFAVDLWEGVNFAKNWTSTCVKNSDENCLEMEQTASSGKLTNACKTCREGYYLESGKCVENPAWAITNCEKYSSPSVCEMCASTHYLDCNECKERSTYDSCSVGDWHRDKCFECLATHYLNSSGTCTSRTNAEIAECSKLKRTADFCETCNENFQLTDDRIACFADISNCSAYKRPVYKADTKMTCVTCSNSHYKTEDSTQCNPQNVLNCDDYVNNSSNVCQTCDTGYYLDSANNMCHKREIANCKEPKDNFNECDVCDNLYKRENATTCTAINSPDCIENEQNSDDCKKCVPHRFLKNDGTRKVCVAVIKSLEVDDCDYNTGTNEAIGCSHCKSFNISVQSLSLNHIIDFPQGCVKYDDECEKCGDNYDHVKNADDEISCVLSTDTTSGCKNLTEDTFGTIAKSEGICHECKDLSTHYKWSDSCWQRTSQFDTNCQTKSDSAEECLVCKEGFSAKEGKAPDGATCVQNPTGFTPITGCTVHNVWDSAKCVQCDWDYNLTQQGLCVLRGDSNTTVAALNAFDKTTRSLGFYYNYKAHRSLAKEYVKMESYDFKSESKPVTGYTVYVSSKDLAYSYYNKGIYRDISRQYATDDKDWAQKDDGNGGKTPYVTGTDCELSYRRSGTLFCIKCKNGMNPKYLPAKYDASGNDVSSNEYATVESCTTDSNSVILSKKYYALGFRPDNNENNSSKFLSEIHYDSCPNEDHNLVVIVSDATQIYDVYKVKQAQTSGEERAFCYDFGSSPPTQHCHVMAVDLNSTPGYNYRTGPFYCVSCKPGYRPTFESSNTKKVTACTKIANCDDSDPAKNTWMNACETCAANHVHVMKKTTSGSKDYLDISTCASRQIDGCLIQNDAGNECEVCDLGLVLSNTNAACEAVSPALPNCTKTGFQSGQIKDVSYSFINDSSAYSYAAYIQKKFESVSAKHNCVECATDHSLFNVPNAGSTFYCEANQTIIDGGTTLTDNCKLYSGGEANKCIECNSTHILDKNNACVDKATLPSTVYVDNCKVLDSAADPKVCDTCLAGSFQNTTTKECISLVNCAEYEMDNDLVVCKKCVEGKMVDYRDKTLCIDIIIPHCKIFEDGVCKQCKDGYTTMKIKKTYGSNKTVTYCFKDAFSDPKMNADVLFDFQAYSSTSFTLNTMNTFNELQELSDKESDVFTRGLCPQKFMPYCGDSYNNMTCEECEDGAWMDDNTEVCIPNTIAHCKDQKNLYECDECNDGYFRNDIKQCQKQNVDDCSKYLKTEPGCEECSTAHYLKEKKCYPHTVENCSEYKDDSDECAKCNEFYYRHEGGCKAHTVSGCKQYEDDKNTCKNCHERYYKDDDVCSLNTGKNCKTYLNDENGCSSCFTDSDTTHEKNFIIQGEDCVPVEEIPNCVKYLITSNSSTCDECAEKHFKNNGKCKPFPTGMRYCEVFESASTCTKCVQDFFMDANTANCQPIYKPIFNCENYSSLTECQACKMGYMLSEAKDACVLYTGVGCKEYATFDSCSSCEPSMALIETDNLSSDGVNRIKKCESKINNCTELETTESTSDITDVHGGVRTIKSYTYKCKKCSAGYLADEESGQCETSRLISNCHLYSADGTCETCNDGYWRSKDKKSCVQDLLLEHYGCSDAQMVQEITCNVCKSGFMMDSAGECVECGGTGCAVCDPESTSKCSLCAPGYYMTSSSTCNRNENYSFILRKEEIAGGDPINIAQNKVVSADEGKHEDDVNFGMKVSAFILGLITLLVGLF